MGNKAVIVTIRPTVNSCTSYSPIYKYKLRQQ